MNDRPAPLRVLEPRFVDYGDTPIPYFLTRSERKHVSIEVHPDLVVMVNAPRHATMREIAAIVERKAAWILRQQRAFADLLPYTPARRFVSGESHLYLGRKYRLKIHEAAEIETAKLAAGYLHVYTNAPNLPDATQALLAEWYRGHAERVFPQRLEVCASHAALRAVPRPRLFIRLLRKRWGSCSTSGRLTLNVSLIRAPRGCIDYVITHELCHLLVPNHSSKFIRLLNRVMPDWRDRKQQLERMLA